LRFSAGFWRQREVKNPEENRIESFLKQLEANTGLKNTGALIMFLRGDGLRKSVLEVPIFFEPGAQMQESFSHFRGS
jgi:hypothetical protein